MKKVDKSEAEAFEPCIHALAEFRYMLRKFLHFSEEAATRVGLTPQQHQLLLQIAGAPRGTVTAVFGIAPADDEAGLLATIAKLYHAVMTQG